MKKINLEAGTALHEQITEIVQEVLPVVLRECQDPELPEVSADAKIGGLKGQETLEKLEISVVCVGARESGVLTGVCGRCPVQRVGLSN